MSGDSFNDLFRACQRSAFHLETRDTYHVPAEAESFRAFLAGEPAEDRSGRPWYRMIRETTARGVHVSRVRVVSEPLVDYQRWMLSLTRLNVDAGEDIRYLPRTEAPAAGPDDFWLFDDGVLAFNLVDSEGVPAGLAVTEDQNFTAVCRHVRDTLWDLATPFSEYAARQ